MSLIATFCWCIYIIFLGCACHWLLHFCWCYKYVVGKRPEANLGVNGYVSETRVIMWFGHWNYMGAYFQAPCAAPGQSLMETYFCTSETNMSLMYKTQWTTRSNYIHCHSLTNWYLSDSHNMSPCTWFLSKFLSVCRRNWLIHFHHGFDSGKKIWDQNLGCAVNAGIKITWVHVSRLLVATPRQWPMEMHYVH